MLCYVMLVHKVVDGKYKDSNIISIPSGMTRKYTELIHLYKDSVYISMRNQMYSGH